MGLLEFNKLPINTLVGADWKTFNAISDWHLNLWNMIRYSSLAIGVVEQPLCIMSFHVINILVIILLIRPYFRI